MRAAGIAADVVAPWHGHTERMTQADYGRVTDDRLTAASAVFSSVNPAAGGRRRGGKMGVASVRHADMSVMPFELVGSVWRWEPPTGTVDCCREHADQIL